MQAMPVNQTFTGPGEFEADATVTLTIQIQHTPNDEGTTTRDLDDPDFSMPKTKNVHFTRL